MTVDKSGNVIVTGKSSNGLNDDYATVAYSGGGTALWTNRYNGPGNGTDKPQAITVDDGGNVFVTGLSVGTSSSYDYATIKSSNTGMPLWTNRYNGKANQEDWPYSIAVDRTGNVFVTGFSNNGTNFDFLTVAYSTVGLSLWTNRFNAPGNGDDIGAAITVDADGNVLVTGSGYFGNGTSSDFITIKYSNAGIGLLTKRLN